MWQQWIVSAFLNPVECLCSAKKYKLYLFLLGIPGIYSVQ